MIGAVYSGILTPNAQPLQASCPTGNCTWPSTSTLAVCGGCLNSTYTLKECSGTACAIKPSATGPVEADCENPPNGSYCVNASTCKYILASGSEVHLMNMKAYWETPTEWWPYIGMGDLFQVAPGGGTDGAFGDSTNRMYLIRFDSIRFDLFGVPYNSVGMDDPPLSITECALWMCIQVYNTSIQASLQNQTLVSTLDYYNYTEHTQHDEDTLVFPPIPASLPGSNQTNFTMDANASNNLADYLWTILNGTVSMPGPIEYHVPLFSNDVMRSIWNATTDPQGWISNLASSMTNVVRQ